MRLSPSLKPFKTHVTHVTRTEHSLCTPTPTPTQRLIPTFKPHPLLHSKYGPGFFEPELFDTQPSRLPARLGKRWMEFQGVRDWAGLLDPLDDSLGAEIIRYCNFVEAAYRAFEFNPSLSSYGSCKYNKRSMFEEVGFPNTGYRLSRNLWATSGIQLPPWIPRSNWIAKQSSWIGYVAVCHDRAEINRLGRRDIVVALRGTATCLEWLENLRATLAPLAGPSEGPMVETGFLSLYTSRTSSYPSLQETIRKEVGRILDLYPDEPLSLTLTGHSLGAALATLAAYDIKTTFKGAPLVTVVSVGGPRVGNRSFRSLIDTQGTKILRIVNPNDLITKVPGFVIDNNNNNEGEGEGEEEMHPLARFWPGWVRKRIKDKQWVYAELGCELRLTGNEPGLDQKRTYNLSKMNLAKCHDLKTYMDLVKMCSSKCPLRAGARMMLMRHRQRRQQQRQGEVNVVDGNDQEVVVQIT